jgi:HSP20 family protein
MFEDFGLRSSPRLHNVFLPGRQARNYPLVNLYEEQDALYLEALAPGLDPANIKISVLENVLTISGEKRRVPGDIKPEAFHRSERATGHFVRTVTLPIAVEVNAIQADYSNGLLTITLPKAEKAKPKQIAVNVA